LLLTGVTVIVTLGFAVWFFWPQPQSSPEFIKKAEMAFQSEPTTKPTLEDVNGRALSKQDLTAVSNSRPYDIDQTVYALYAIEKIMDQSSSFEELTAFVLQRDSDLVASDVSTLKHSLFSTYKTLLDIKDDQRQIQNTFELWSNVLKNRLATTSISANITGPVPAIGLQANVDHEVERLRFEEELENRKVEKVLLNKIKSVKDELLAFQFRYNELYSKYMIEWDRLCSLRDEAFYATYNGNWDQAIEAATKAVDLAPNEREAHILLAMALIESNDKIEPFAVEDASVTNIQTRNQLGRIAAASALLEKFVEDRNSLYAPAHLLRGVLKMKAGDSDAAFVYFDQAAAYFPQHKNDLIDKLNLYKKRAYLRDSREGNRLWSLYKSLMSGSGYFSPEFQKARILMEKGDTSEARDMVFDHFQRRKNQGDWAKVLDDFRFANLFLGTSLTKIEGADAQDFGMLLKDSSSWTNLYSDRIQVNLLNKSKIDLHNVSILICVRFTDMFKKDCVAFPVEKTFAAVNAGDTLAIEVNDIKKITISELGSERQFSDIINYGAVLISDELIVWANQASRASGSSVEEAPKGN